MTWGNGHDLIWKMFSIILHQNHSAYKIELKKKKQDAHEYKMNLRQTDHKC